MINTIVLAAAGRGTRFGALTQDLPKHLLPISGKPFLQYVLERIVAAGFTDIVCVIDYQADKMRHFFSHTGLPIRCVVQSQVVGKRYGTAAVVEAAGSLLGPQPFVFQNGDTLFSAAAYAAARQDDGYHHIFGVHHPQPQHYGVIEFDAHNRVRQVIEKPVQPASYIINAGLYTFQPDIFDYVRQVPLSARNEYEIIDALNLLAAAGRLRFALLPGDYTDLGTPTDIPAVTAYLARPQEV